jgi:hypothetical protein
MSGVETATTMKNRRREAAMTDDFRSRIEKAVKRGKRSGTPDWGKRFLSLVKEHRVDLDDPVQRNAVNAANQFWIEVPEDNKLIQAGTWT